MPRFRRGPELHSTDRIDRGDRVDIVRGRHSGRYGIVLDGGPIEGARPRPFTGSIPERYEVEVQMRSDSGESVLPVRARLMRYSIRKRRSP
jgi:hypothetical protein